ncbi:MAG: 30S ribosomal protein THX [Bacteroidales bacterium]|nr:30S ribosomal protein THX [Bacteroidales bacterium]
MGKGDKKTKRGKIIIGSSGITRTRKKKKTIIQSAPKPEPTPKKVVEPVEIEAAKTVAKKTTKKVVEPAEGEEKVKTPKTRKKSASSEE